MLSGGTSQDTTKAAPARPTIAVHVPGPIRKDCGGAATIHLAATDVRELLEAMARKFPELHRNICDETGAVRRHINIFVNTINTRDGDGIATTLAPGDSVTILPAVSGGSSWRSGP